MGRRLSALRHRADRRRVGYKYFGDTRLYAAGAERWSAASVRTAHGPTLSAHLDVPSSRTAFGLSSSARPRPGGDERCNTPSSRRKEKPKPGAKDATADWNQHRATRPTSSRWMGARMEHDLNWQIVNLSGKPADLLERRCSTSPATSRFGLSDRRQAELKLLRRAGRDHPWPGGLRKSRFAESFKALGQELFPAYKFRLLRRHFVFTEQYPASNGRGRSRWKDGNGCRGADAARPAPRRRPKLAAPGDRAQGVSLRALQHLPLRRRPPDLRYKGDTYVITPDESIKPRAPSSSPRALPRQSGPRARRLARLSAVSRSTHSSSRAERR